MLRQLATLVRGRLPIALRIPFVCAIAVSISLAARSPRASEAEVLKLGEHYLPEREAYWHTESRSFPAETEVVVWAECEHPGAFARVRLNAGDQARVATAIPGYPVAVAQMILREAGDVAITLECAAPEPIRYAIQTFPMPTARHAELTRLRDAIETVRGRDVAAYGSLFDDLLGDDFQLNTWQEVSVALVLGPAVGNAPLPDLARRIFGATREFLEPRFPPPTSSLIQARTLEARALAASERHAEGALRLRELIPVLEASRGVGSINAITARQDLAKCVRLSGDLEGARLELTYALENAAELDPHSVEQLRIRHNLAIACFQLGDYWRSLALDREALQWATEHDAPAEVQQQIRLQMSLTTKIMGVSGSGFIDELAQALDGMREVHAPDSEDVLRLESNLGQAYKDSGRFAEALPLLTHVLETRERLSGSNHPTTVQARIRYASLLRLIGDLDAALELQRALLADARATEPPNHPAVANAERNMTATLADLGRIGDALEHALRWAEALRLQLRSTAVSTWRERRESASKMRQDVAAIVLFGQKLTDSKTIADWEKTIFELLESSRAAVASGPIRIRNTESSDALRSLRNELNAARRKMDERPSPPDSTTPDGLAVARVEQELAQALVEHGLSPFAIVDADKLAARLPRNAAAVGFAVLDLPDVRPRAGASAASTDAQPRPIRRYRVHALTPSGKLAVHHGASLANLESSIAAWRDAIGQPAGRGGGTPDESSARQSGNRLVQLLFGNVLDELGEDVDQLYFCSESVLDLVPIDALPWDDGYLGDRYQIRSQVSFDSLLRNQVREDRPPRFVGVGGLDYGDGVRFAPLPGSKSEIRSVAARFGAEGHPTALIEADGATEAAVLDALSGATDALLATHGYGATQGYGEQATPGDTHRSALARPDEHFARATLAPLSLCGLALSDANSGVVWTGESIARADLSSLRLVVLSACDGHAGIRRAGQGVLSLRSALHAAGAACSLTSLWPVKDNYARQLVSRFFELYLAGNNPTESLWQAKREMSEELSLPARFWAGWILTGDTRP